MERRSQALVRDDSVCAGVRLGACEATASTDHDPEELPMPVERHEDHPTFELGGNTITSLAGPSRGAEEAALYRVDVPPGGELPRHRHDHLDVFTLEHGSGTVLIDDDAISLATGDSVVVPKGAWHVFEAGDGGATLIVTMLAGTKMVREDGSETVPPWVS
jgi:quercetin dioxygenase-like cupin family protein